MKVKVFFTAVIILFVVYATTSFAQHKPHAPGADKKPLQQITAFPGQVTGWVNNDDFIYEGFYLQSGNTKYMVKFPTHMGIELTAAVKTGNTATVNGVEKASATGEKEINLVSILADGKTINESTPAKVATPPAKELTTASGKITLLQKDRHGKVNGFILENKTILRVSQPVAEQILKLAVVGTTISCTGEKQNLHNGEATAEVYTIIRCKTITINGKQYLTK
ncbi:MAG: hypothetical protein WCO44_06295 [Bacteroidota bacterium]